MVHLFIDFFWSTLETSSPASLLVLFSVVHTTRPAVLPGHHVLRLLTPWSSTLLSSDEHKIVTLEVSTPSLLYANFYLPLSPFAVVYIVIIFCMDYIQCLLVTLDQVILAMSGCTMIWTSSKKWSFQLFASHSNCTRYLFFIVHFMGLKLGSVGGLVRMRSLIQREPRNKFMQFVI